MGCCGKRRAAFPGMTSASAPAVNRLSSQPRPAGGARVVFEYVGRTALTAVGRTTGLRYRFERPGARVAVDPRDRASLASVPVLCQVQGR